MTPLLFVYGTLRPRAATPAARYLARNAWYLGPARARGRLYRLDGYPGLVEARQSIVTGDLYRLRRPRRLIEILDYYEGPAFERRAIWITQDRVPVRRAWAYLYRGPLDNRRRIVSGDWRARGHEQ